MRRWPPLETMMTAHNGTQRQQAATRQQQGSNVEDALSVSVIFMFRPLPSGFVYTYRILAMRAV